jgi:hypothetical protein
MWPNASWAVSAESSSHPDSVSRVLPLTLPYRCGPARSDCRIDKGRRPVGPNTGGTGKIVLQAVARERRGIKISSTHCWKLSILICSHPNSEPLMSAVMMPEANTSPDVPSFHWMPRGPTFAPNFMNPRRASWTRSSFRPCSRQARSRCRAIFDFFASVSTCLTIRPSPTVACGRHD